MSHLMTTAAVDSSRLPENRNPLKKEIPHRLPFGERLAARERAPERISSLRDGVLGED